MHDSLGSYRDLDLDMVLEVGDGPSCWLGPRLTGPASPLVPFIASELRWARGAAVQHELGNNWDGRFEAGLKGQLLEAETADPSPPKCGHCCPWLPVTLESEPHPQCTERRGHARARGAV